MKTSEKLKKNIKPIAIAGAAVACLGIAGVSAYFTDAGKITNTFTVGSIKVKPEEPHWDPENPPEDITPNQEFAKDPQVENVGKNDAYIFLQVKVPKANVVVAGQDGKKAEAAVTELFSYEINSGWAQIAEDTSDEEFNLYTYVYGTGANAKPTPLAKDATTPTLFDHIKFANVVEDEGLEGKQLDVEVTTYAIQTNYLTDGDNNGEDNSSATTAAKIWEILKNQGPTVETITDTGYVSASQASVNTDDVTA